MKILVAEDEKELNGVITRRLIMRGYSVDSAYDGEQAMERLRFSDYDAVVMDIMMPHTSGLKVLEWMRAIGDKMPVILLTAKDTVADRVEGLNAGADDYLIKPFSFDELVARINAITRRQNGTAGNTLTVDDLCMDLDKRSVTRSGKDIVLSSKEFSMLEYLIKNKGIVLSREKIEDQIWNYCYDGGSNVVDVYISYLRKKIDDGFEKKLIRTVRGVGYMIVK